MDFTFRNKRKPQKGFVLISDPFTKNNYFERSVVYICNHDDEGTFGFVINNFIDLNLSEIAINFPNIAAKISIGGPVQTEHIYFIHTEKDLLPNSVEVADGIFIGENYDQLLQLIDNKKILPSKVRFFLGYSGWEAGQLDEELENNSWIVAPVLNPLEIMDTSIKNIWHRFMKREGQKFDILSKAPIDFFDN